jgi:two-component system, NtrC family, nitrogen regulation sensor histidine kinase NtrY
MDFNSRTSRLLLTVLFAIAVTFTYDAISHGFWASMALGMVLAAVFLGVSWVSLTGAQVRAGGVAPVTTDSGHDLRVMLDQVPIPLVRYVQGDHPEALNKAARSLFQTDDAILQDGDSVIRAICEANVGVKATLTILGRPFAVSVAEIVSDQGHVRLATFTDVQVEMHKAEATALKETLHILSHEIMNSLTPVASLAEIANACVSQEPPDLAAAREALETLSRRSVSLTRFIEAYRSVARLPDPVLQSVDPGRLVKDILELFIRTPANSEVDFQLDIHDRLPRLRLDEAQISQAVINVVTNALEATETTGRLRHIHVSVHAARQSVVIRISDNGDGVPEILRPNLFSAFATTKPKGTGTGLNLARQITLAHGGNLQLMPEPLSGTQGEKVTTFAFTFPVQG